MRRALINTSIYSLAMRGHPYVPDHLQQLDEIGFSVVSLGELLGVYLGAALSRCANMLNYRNKLVQTKMRQ